MPGRETEPRAAPDPAAHCGEIAALRMAASSTLRALLDMALMTGLRKKDLLGLQIADLTERGIEVRTSKTGVPICFRWSEGLRKAVEQAKGNRQIGPLFITRRGRAWTSTELDTAWDRLRAKAKVEGLHWHDLRALALTMADRTMGREYARLLAGHQDAATTDRYLRDRSAREVAPLDTRHFPGYETGPSGGGS